MTTLLTMKDRVVNVVLRHFGTGHFDTRTLWHPPFWHPDIMTTRYSGTETFWHQDILPPRHYATQTLCHCVQIKTFWHPDILTTRHFVNQTLCHPDIVPLRTNLDILTPRHFATQTFCHTSHFDTQTFGNRSALSYSNNYPNSCNLGTAHTGWPSTITVQRLAFWLNESLIRSDRISIH